MVRTFSSPHVVIRQKNAVKYRITENCFENQAAQETKKQQIKRTQKKDIGFLANDRRFMPFSIEALIKVIHIFKKTERITHQIYVKSF